MPIRDIAAMNRSLDNDYGPTRGPNAAASHLLALFDGDPMVDVAEGGGEEVSGNGYARVSIAPADWSPAANGYKPMASPKVFPDTTAEWPNGASYWALIDGGDGVTMWDCGPLAEPLEITGPGPGPVVSISVFYDDAVTVEEE